MNSVKRIFAFLLTCVSSAICSQTLEVAVPGTYFSDNLMLVAVPVVLDHLSVFHFKHTGTAAGGKEREMRTPESRRESDRKYHVEHAERIRAQQKLYYQSHKAQCLAASKQWARKNREKRRIIRLKYMRLHPEKHRESRRKSYIKYLARNQDKQRQQRYGMCGAEFRQMEKEQNGKCAICGVHASLCVDHNHSTGVIRKLLCNQCNVGIGCLRENPNICERAAEYLREHGGEEISEKIEQTPTETLFDIMEERP